MPTQKQLDEAVRYMRHALRVLAEPRPVSPECVGTVVPLQLQAASTLDAVNLFLERGTWPTTEEVRQRVKLLVALRMPELATPAPSTDQAEEPRLQPTVN